MKELKVATVPFDTLIYNDSGSGAHKNLATWKPTCEYSIIL